MSNPSLNSLTDRYLNGLATPEDLADLERRLCADRESAGAFAFSVRLETNLVEQFRQQACVPRAETILKIIHGRTHRLTGHRRLWASLAAAAGLVLVVGAALWQALGEPPTARVLSGRVLVNGQEVRQVMPGSAIEIAPGQPAALELSDGSRATFEPNTRAVLHGRQQATRQVVELTRGSGAFASGRMPTASWCEPTWAASGCWAPSLRSNYVRMNRRKERT